MPQAFLQEVRHKNTALQFLVVATPLNSRERLGHHCPQLAETWRKSRRPRASPVAFSTIFSKNLGASTKKPVPADLGSFASPGSRRAVAM